LENTILKTKQHYPILDGLRGVACISILVFHLIQALSKGEQYLMYHGYLAVDFFFLLSGFVVGYAYDDRWPKMTTWDFFKIRLVRLHPMVVLAVIWAACCFLLDPYFDPFAHTTLAKFLLTVVISFTLFPTPDILGKGVTHSLNDPFWSLFQEYVANIAYALVARKLPKIVLLIFITLCLSVLGISAYKHGSIGGGWAFSSFKIAFFRMSFSFFAGLLLFRQKWLVKVRWPFIVCSSLLVLTLFVPEFKLNVVSDILIIAVVFPLIVMMAAGSPANATITRVSHFLGDLSYPLYIIHFPIILIFEHWVDKKNPDVNQIVLVFIGTVIVIIGIAYLFLKLYDIPVRAWLKTKLSKGK
jgi:peptidoglycan/LPS O-acetylase OafA/YrhL